MQQSTLLLTISNAAAAAAADSPARGFSCYQSAVP